MPRFLLLGVILLNLSLLGFSQRVLQPVKVFVSSAGNDSIGSQFTDALRKEIGTSKAYTLASQRLEFYGLAYSHLAIAIASLPVDDRPESHMRSAVSVVAQTNASKQCPEGRLISHMVVMVGASNTTLAARKVLQTIQARLARAREEDGESTTPVASK